jgi:sugar phosphate isomerase/epimerase
MLGPDDLLVTASTLGHPPLPELVEAARAGGFTGLSIWPHETWLGARRDGLSVADMRSLLDDHGLVVNDVDALVCHLPAAKASSVFEGEALMYEAGEALGARYINVVMISEGEAPLDQMAEVFAGVAGRAAEHGLKAYLEFVPFMSVPDLRTAWQVVERSGCERTGIMVDTWHCHRGATSLDDLRAIPGERVLGTQVNDAPAESMDDPVIETLHHRLVPGEGDIDLDGWLGVLHQIGSVAPLCAEIFSDELLAWGSPRQIARRVGDAMRAVRARARAAA